MPPTFKKKKQKKNIKYKFGNLNTALGPSAKRNSNVKVNKMSIDDTLKFTKHDAY